VLENLAATFMHPSVMDVKLGTVLYGPDATPEKKARMEKKAKESTIGSKGMRMTGCKVS
jgi:1D-myo-inositol-tetrakisphosphate 5-kinase/inositol-polyphosphate multikinase